MKRGLARALVRVSEDLDRIGRPYALVGGLAVSARCEPRFTRDIDLAVAVDTDASAERFVANLGYAIESTVEHSAVSRLATVRLRGPGGRTAPIVDLLFASSGIEREICDHAEELEIVRGVRLRVACASDLIALKILSEADRREQDRVDLVHLLRHASAEDLARAESALELIARRGFARGKDLTARLAHFRARARADG
ncbi:MAG: nucleotidyl transferase AbiEii/AbiGii toxin family protein [Deltaproteobacteria bacterium]|nr:nucleotidyl transferase AbiEii/AbiGii toxin family protein [Deltaproteobacteria bacterium]